MVIHALVMSLAMCLSGNEGVTIHVSSQGQDGASGAVDAPLASLDAARDRARERRAEHPDSPLTIMVHGVHFLPEGLALHGEDSGTKEVPIIWRGAEGAHLVGGLVLDAWEELDEGLWSAPYPAPYTPSEILEDGQALVAARFPKSGYLPIKGPVEGNEHEAFYYNTEDLVGEEHDFKGGRVFLWPGHDWFSATLPIGSVDPEAGSIQLAGRTGYDMRPGNRFRIENVRSFLTEPGEYVLDDREQRIYLKTRSGEAPGERIWAATAKHVLHLEGSSESKIRHVTIESLDMTASTSHGVYISHAEDLRLDSCRIAYAGESGIHIGGHAQRMVVERCEIRHMGLHGVVLHGLGVGAPDVNHHHRIHNNHIHHGGRLVGHGCGVYITQSGHNEITNNEIHDMPRYATTIKGLRYQLLREQVAGVTWENRHDFLHSRKNRIAFNHIYRVNLDSQDTGAMESWGPGRDNVYDHNLIHDVGNDTFDLQMGIYLDDASDYFTVTNNIIYDVRGTRHVVAIYSKGIGNRLENNLFVVTPPMDAALLSFFMAEERADHHIYRRNIFYFESPGAAIHHFINWSDDRIAESDENLYWHKHGDRLHFRNAPVSTYDEWQQLFDGQYDGNSLVADPLFEDVGTRDFRLKAQSPALGLGFKPIDRKKIGRRSDFPTRLR